MAILDAVPGLAVPGAVNPGSPELIITTCTFIGPVPVTYLRLLGSNGSLHVTPGQVVNVSSVMLASGDAYRGSFPPADGKWLVGGVIFGVRIPLKERIADSGFSIHDEWCNLCFSRHWESDCTPADLPERQLKAARMQAQMANTGVL